MEYIGTEPWKPKEALEEDGEISDKADIFAYGLTLWEMMTLEMPHLGPLNDAGEVTQQKEKKNIELRVRTSTCNTDVILRCGRFDGGEL